jgi:hypothetical protein
VWQLLDADKVDRAHLAQALGNLLGVDDESGRVVCKPGFNRLNSRHKLVACFLGRKAAILLGRSEVEEVAPKDIPGETGLPKGTVYPKLKELREARLVSQTASGDYYISPHQVMKAIEDLQKGGVQWKT